MRYGPIILKAMRDKVNGSCFTEHPCF